MENSEREDHPPKSNLKKMLLFVPVAGLLATILGIVLVQWRANEEHSRRRPMLDFDKRLGLVSLDKPIGLFVKNNGSTPALIKRMRVAVDGKPEGPQITKEDWESALVKVGLPDQAMTFGWFDIDESFQHSDERAILVVLPEDLKKDNLENRFRKALERISVEICYCTVASDNCQYVGTDNVKHAKLPCPSD